ncbi:MAG: hypothetical protein ABJN69_12965 [Hellea sp.]
MTQNTNQAIKQKHPIRIPEHSKYPILTWIEAVAPRHVSFLLSGIPVHLMLNPQTIIEMKEFHKAGLINFRPTHNSAKLGSGIIAGGAIEEMKRPYGQGQSFSVDLNMGSDVWRENSQAETLTLQSA